MDEGASYCTVARPNRRVRLYHITVAEMRRQLSVPVLVIGESARNVGGQVMSCQYSYVCPDAFVLDVVNG
jgi:hypothetical protein